MQNLRYFSLGIFLFLFVFEGIVRAAEPVDPDEDRNQFVVGNIMFVLLHEFSHLVIDGFDMRFSAMARTQLYLRRRRLIRLDRARPDKDYAYIRMLLSAADANRILESVSSATTPRPTAATTPIVRAARCKCMPRLRQRCEDLRGVGRTFLPAGIPVVLVR